MKDPNAFLYRTLREVGRAIAEIEADRYRYRTDPEYRARVDAEDAAEEKRKRDELESRKQVGANFVSDEFREEVVEELIRTEGLSREAALNRTRDGARLIAEADRLGLR